VAQVDSPIQDVEPEHEAVRRSNEANLPA
jgi:hypothetical protein